MSKRVARTDPVLAAAAVLVRRIRQVDVDSLSTFPPKDKKIGIINHVTCSLLRPRVVWGKGPRVTLA